MIDSHLHLDDEKLCSKVDEIYDSFEENNIEFVINNSCDMSTILAGVELANKYDKIYATVGMHPHESKYFNDEFVSAMTQYSQHPKVVAVGEIGLDYYYDLSDRQIQRDVFARQIEIADALHLPLTLHVRDAYGDAWDILRAQKKYLNNGVLWHCYSGSAEFARQMAREGHYFAFGGAITFKNANKADVFEQVPFDKVLSETDSPYMSPVPLRGTVNTPLNIPIIVEKIASFYGKSVEETEARIRENTLRLFPKIEKHLNNR
ncbi:MAG: TatD family hydrolase [Clostridiales bacterium]|nr:TatD family hydrolase [Clostridiales bacterium]